MQLLSFVVLASTVAVDAADVVGACGLADVIPGGECRRDMVRSTTEVVFIRASCCGQGLVSACAPSRLWRIDKQTCEAVGFVNGSFVAPSGTTVERSVQLELREVAGFVEYDPDDPAHALCTHGSLRTSTRSMDIELRAGARTISVRIFDPTPLRWTAHPPMTPRRVWIRRPGSVSTAPHYESCGRDYFAEGTLQGDLRSLEPTWRFGRFVLWQLDSGGKLPSRSHMLVIYDARTSKTASLMGGPGSGWGAQPIIVRRGSRLWSLVSGNAYYEVPGLLRVIDTKRGTHQSFLFGGKERSHYALQGISKRGLTLRDEETDQNLVLSWARLERVLIEAAKPR